MDACCSPEVAATMLKYIFAFNLDAVSNFYNKKMIKSDSYEILFV